MPEVCVPIPYQREKAVAYAHYWAYRRNPEFLSFSQLGGDCTNFVSQCLFAGTGVMNYTPTFGWFYLSGNDRTASWTGVEYLYNFLLQNQGAGPFATEAGIESAQPGDVIQFGDENGDFYHTVIVVEVPNPPTYEGIRVAAHSIDADCRPLDTYNFAKIRLLHIEGARRCISEEQLPAPPETLPPETPPQEVPPVPQPPSVPQAPPAETNTVGTAPEAPGSAPESPYFPPFY